MIKITDLNVVLTDNTGSEVQGTGEMIVGTSPITKEVRDEELNLQNTPNFVISALIPNADVDVTENYNVSFDANEKHYSTVMTVMTKTNLRTGVKVNLQSTGAEITEEDIQTEPEPPSEYRFVYPINYEEYTVNLSTPDDYGTINLQIECMQPDGSWSEVVGYDAAHKQDAISSGAFWIEIDGDATSFCELHSDPWGIVEYIKVNYSEVYEAIPLFINILDKNKQDINDPKKFIQIGVKPIIQQELVYSVHAFDKNDQEIPLNNIPAYQSGTNVVFDGAYLKCREDNSGEWVINSGLLYGQDGNPVITTSQDAQGRSLFMNNLGAYALDWSAFEDNNEQTITFKAVISETWSIDEGEVLTTFDITFVGHPESHTLEFDNDNYDTSYDIYTGEKSQARVNVLYDGTSIHLESSMFNGLDYNKLEPIATSGGIFKAKDDMSNVSVGQYVDEVSVVYEGMTTSCTVTLTVTNSDPDYVPTKRITCTTSRGEFAIYDSESDCDGGHIEYTDAFDRTFTLSDDPEDNMPWVKTQLKYYVDGIEQNVILESNGKYPWDDIGNLRIGKEPSDKYTEYTITGGLGYWDEDNFVEIAPSDTVYKYSKVNPEYTWYVDGDANITPLATQNDSDISGITLTDNIDIYSEPDTMYINGNYDFHIESVGITYDNQNNLIECDPNSDVAFVFKDFADHSQESNYKAHHINQITFGAINTAAANEIANQITTDINGNTVSWVNEEIPDTGRNILTGNIPSVDTIKMNLTPIIQQVGTITIENIQIVGNIGGAGAGEK